MTTHKDLILFKEIPIIIALAYYKLVYRII